MSSEKNSFKEVPTVNVAHTELVLRDFKDTLEQVKKSNDMLQAKSFLSIKDKKFQKQHQDHFKKGADVEMFLMWHVSNLTQRLEQENANRSN